MQPQDNGNTEPPNLTMPTEPEATPASEPAQPEFTLQEPATPASSPTTNPASRAASQ